MVGSLMEGLAGYVVFALAAARRSYGRQRAVLVERSYQPGGDGDREEYFREYDQQQTVNVAVLFGAFWPVTLPLYCAGRLVVRLVTARPPRPPVELRSSSDDLGRRIRELERELEQETGLREPGR